VVTALHNLDYITELLFEERTLLQSEDREHSDIPVFSAAAVIRKHTDLVSLKTARVQALGFEVVDDVNGAIENPQKPVLEDVSGDGYSAIYSSILPENRSSYSVADVRLCYPCSGKG